MIFYRAGFGDENLKSVISEQLSAIRNLQSVILKKQTNL